MALGLGLAACQRGMSVGFTTAAALVHELMEARDERRLLNLQRQLSRLNLLIIDELGFVPLSPTGAELLFEVFSQRYERGSILVTTNLPFDEWTEIFGSERLTGTLLDRLTHHVHILEMNGDSYRLRHSRDNAPPVFGRDGRLLGSPVHLPAYSTGCRRKGQGDIFPDQLVRTFMLAIYPGWYSFTPPLWPTFPPPLTAVVVEGDAEAVGGLKWQHLKGAPFPVKGAPFPGLVFCAKTIIPDSEEHPFTPSANPQCPLLRWIRA